MYLCAWTINHGQNILTDHYELIDNIGAVDKWKKEIHHAALGQCRPNVDWGVDIIARIIRIVRVRNRIGYHQR